MPLSVVLDPGHGGSARRGNSSPDGARFGDGRLEKQLNFALAQRVSQHLGGARLTRGEHENRGLGERIQAARDDNAQAFVSLHTSAGGPAQSSIWVHPRASPQSLQLAELIKKQLGPAYGGVQLSRGELAVLSPDHHSRSTAACLVEIGCGGQGDLDGAAAAIARGVRGHFGRLAYGRSTDRGLDIAAPILSGSIGDMLRQIADYLSRQAVWSGGVADTTGFPFSAICKLKYRRTNGRSAEATGFYISSDKVLTAGHVAIRGTATIASMEVHPGMNGTDVFPVVNVTDGANVIPYPAYVGSRISDNDLAVIKVSRPPPNGLFFNIDSTPASIAPIAICGYAAETVDATKQHLDTDSIRSVSSNLETADYNASTEHGTSGAPVFYTRAVEDQQAQQSRIDTAVVGVHVSSASVDGGADNDAIYNSCCRLTDAKVNWIWSL